jgi:hypothetical protein
VRRAPDPVMIEYVTIPKEIMDLDKNITIAADVMFVNGPPFVVNFSGKVKFTTMEYVHWRLQHIIVTSQKKIFNIYKSHSLKVETTLMDREFVYIRADIPKFNLNTTSTSEHVPGI